ncbi:MAG: sensor histidine kinase, partial [Candidatus Binatia bacterium]
LGIVLVGSGSWPSTLEIGQRIGYLVFFAMGSGALARQTHRHLQARVREEAHRLAVEEVTATVSHDLKNPLAAVAGLVDMLLDSAADNLSLDQRALLHRIDANTRQMSNLVANLLDAELIGRGLQTFRPAPTDLNALVRRVAEAQAHQAEAKQIGLVLDLNPRLPIAVVDGRMIERLVANLLSNAVKFTPESGAIRVSTHPLGSRIGIEVWDSGPGVAPALRSSLFQKFVHQEDTPGIGLGLYICKSVVEQHRGSISVSNAPGGGVAFVAELPVGKPANVAARTSQSGRRRPRAHRAPWHVRRQVGALMRG